VSLDLLHMLQVLFQKPFFEHMHRALKPGGAICTQAESIWLHMPFIKSLAKMCKEVFRGGSVHYAYTTIPTYPSGQIGFMVCSKQAGNCKGPLDMREARRAVDGLACKYYNAAVHQAAFVLPQFALDEFSEDLTFQSQRP
jgi:spermidine synthase